MFIRRKKNASGSTSIQIIQKYNGRYKVLQTVGSAVEEKDILVLIKRGKQEQVKLQGQQSLFLPEKDITIEGYLSQLQNAQISTIGPELVFGRLYDHIGYGVIEEPLFKHLVVARLAFPLSKLKTIEYLYRFQGVSVHIDTVYRFLDKLNEELKEQVEQISFAHTKRVLGNKIAMVFYDMTTLYFEASDEDDLRKTGFSKDGKHSNPQIFLGLLVGLGGYAIGYDIYEGNISEGHTLIPIIEKLSKKFNLDKPIVVADAGLLSKANVAALEQQGYGYILGAKIKTESKAVKEKIITTSFGNEDFIEIEKGTSRLIVQYAKKRATNDAHNRKRGYEKLEKKIKAGKLTKEHINNRGYNKYLKMEGTVNIGLDKEKYEADKKWDGLKGYVTNSKLTAAEVMNNYRNLWHIEKAFRISKTDLKIRPLYHRLRRRIEAHICISFVAYSIYKELERILKIEKFELSVEKAAEITHNIYQLQVVLPQSLQTKFVKLKMDEQQQKLIDIIGKYC